jgi:hypothetical protein
VEDHSRHKLPKGSKGRHNKAKGIKIISHNNKEHHSILDKDSSNPMMLPNRFSNLPKEEDSSSTGAAMIAHRRHNHSLILTRLKARPNKGHHTVRGQGTDSNPKQVALKMQLLMPLLLLNYFS